MVCFEIYTFRNEIKFETVFLYLFWLSRSIFSFFLPRFGFVLLVCYVISYEHHIFNLFIMLFSYTSAKFVSLQLVLYLSLLKL